MKDEYEPKGNWFSVDCVSLKIEKVKEWLKEKKKGRTPAAIMQFLLPNQAPLCPPPPVPAPAPVQPPPELQPMP